MELEGKKETMAPHTQNPSLTPESSKKKTVKKKKDMEELKKEVLMVRTSKTIALENIPQPST
jgi:hypothetical protein